MLQSENPAELDKIFLRLYDDSISSSPQWWGSYDPDNFISWYAVTNYWEDFAENIAVWGGARDSIGCLYEAIDLAQVGKPLMLEKYLFAMKYFRSQINGRDVLYIYSNSNTAYSRDTLPARFDMFTGQLTFLNTGDKIIDFIYNGEGRLVEVRTRDLTPTERVLFTADNDQNGLLNFSEWWDARGRLYSCLGAVNGGTDPTKPAYVKELDFNADGFIDSADVTILNGLEPSSIYNVSASLFGASGDNSNIKIYAGGYIKITMPDGRVIGGKIGDYMTFQTNVYWKITTRAGDSLDVFEIYQQQGDSKVLLAKRFYDTQNRLIADMTATGGPIRVGIKDYTYRTKTIFTISSVTPNDLLKDITLENISIYAQGEKVVYLYDSQHNFEDIPLFCMTDPQMFADQPILTVYYQTSENNKISSWHYQGVPQGIFIVNGDADIASLITDSTNRTPENINNLIQGGDDVFLMMGQMVIVLGRSLYYGYNSSTGTLNFFDANTGEAVASVPYPVADRVIIDNEEYEIRIENGILSLIPPILYEYSVSLFGSSGDGSNVKIYDNGHIKITMRDGRIIEGYLGDYMTFQTNVYWKITTRADGSLDIFEIYQQQGDEKVLLAKRFYNEKNQIMADMTATGGPIRIGIKDYTYRTKTIFAIATDNPNQLLKDLNLENIWDYSAQEKTVYLYDDTQNFEDVPLFAMTDPQMFADQPVITLYYQTGDDKKINAWQYRDRREYIFIVNNGADVASLLQDTNRTSENINTLIQNGDDISLLGGQTVTLPEGRSLVYDYDCSNGYLIFFDANTYESIAEVKYPETNVVTIDDKNYKITAGDSIIELKTVFMPFTISVSTSIHGNKDLTITVDGDYNATVTWYGTTYNGRFDPDSMKVIIENPYQWSGTSQWVFKFTDAYSLESFEMAYDYYGRSSTVYKFADDLLMSINSRYESGSYSSISDTAYSYIAINGKSLIISIDTSYSYTSSYSGVTYTGSGQSKTFYAYDVEGIQTAWLYVGNYTYNGKASYYAAYMLYNKEHIARTDVYAYNADPNLMGLIKSADDYQLVDQYTYTKNTTYFEDTSYSWSKRKYSIEYAKDSQGQFIAKKVYDKNWQTYIVVGNPDLLSGEMNDIFIKSYQTINTYNVSYGAAYSYDYNTGQQSYLGYGLIFSKWAKSSDSSYKQITVVVDYPKDSKVKLDGKEYSISIDTAGTVKLIEIIVPVKISPYNPLPLRKAVLKQRQSLLDFVGQSDIEKQRDLLLY